MITTTPLIGRESEIHQILHTLKNPSCQLLTLIGMGGIGKTHLAAHIFQERSQATHDVVWVSLETLPTSDDIVGALVRHPRFEGKLNSPQDILPYLQTQNMLIILDQYEHLAPHADWIMPFLANCPDVKWLVTSQVALNISTGWQIYIQPLSWDGEQSASHQLFAYHAGRLGREAVIKTDIEAVHQICHHLEGHPLAIQLVCRWLKTLSPQDILNHLHTFDLFQTDYADIPFRQRNLWGVLRHIWELLHPQEQLLLSQLAFFDGDFTLEAIQACCDVTLPMLEGLITRSLLINDTGRYRLHSLIRQFVNHHAPARDSFIQRYSAYYVGLMTKHASGIKDARYLSTQALFDREYANIRKGVHQAILLGKHDPLITGLMDFFLYTHTRGRNSDFFKWLTFARDTSEAYSPLWVVATFLQQYIRLMRGDDLALIQADELKLCAQYAKQHRLTSVTAHLIRLDSDILSRQEQHRKALTACERAEAIFSELDDVFELARTWNRMGVIYLYLGNLERATHYLHQSIIKRQNQIYIEWIASLNNLADIQILTGNIEQIKQYALEMHHLSEKINFRIGKAQAHQLDGFIGFLDDNLVAMDVYHTYIQSIDILNWSKHPHIIIVSLTHLMLGDYQQARAHLDTAYPTLSLLRFWYIWCYAWASYQARDTEKLYGYIVDLMPIMHYFQGDLMCFITLLICAWWFDSNDDSTQADTILNLLASHPIAKWAIFARWIQPIYPQPKTPPDLYAKIKRLAPQFTIKTTTIPQMLPALSDREIEILLLVAQDASNGVIAEKCGVAIGTVKVHLHRIYQKLGVTNRIQAVRVAQAHRLLPIH
jgi:DNA-binding CsgD family transcriptional regulator/tetratricopeptide (TPR) repeat protein